MEYIMDTAKSLAQKGKRQLEIAEILGVTDRTVRNYLTRKSAPRKKRNSLLDPYKLIIESILKEDHYYNATLLLEKLQADGYAGQISILRDFMKATRECLAAEAVIRFETIPGLQAQVDWLELGLIRIGPSLRKRYAFVMVLGYSRRPFVCFTESMKMSVLQACHVAAFDHFGGVPQEILYDNMKTAFVYNAAEGHFQPNRELLKLAVHYGFTPRRCRVRRPQTKGKVERFIRYIRSSLLPRIPDLSAPLDELDMQALAWLETVNDKVLREFGETRRERFEKEAPQLRALPATPFDAREVHELVVHRDGTIVFEGNRYSVPPRFIRQFLTLKADTRKRTAAVFSKEQLLREFPLAAAGSHARNMFPEDEAAIRKVWEAARERREKQEALVQKKRSSKEKLVEVETRPPAAYELFCIVGVTA